MLKEALVGEYDERAQRSWSGCSGARMPRYLRDVALAAVAIVWSICLPSGLIYAQQEQPQNVPKLEQPKDIPELRWKGLSFQPGFRIQARYAVDGLTDINDIMIRRVRLKGKGDVFDIAKFYVEFKADNIAQEGKTSTTKVETAYLDFPLLDGDLVVRIGQYDVPFSRNLLTSDGKTLFMDRGRMVDELASLGLVDNAQGLMLFGRPRKGRFEYSLGIFDSEVFETTATSTSKSTKQLMPAGRLAVNLFDAPKPGGYADYQASYIGEGQRLSFGLNGASLGNVRDGSSEFDLFGWGGDVFGNYRSFTLEAEYDVFKKDGPVDVEGRGWYVQAGYVLPIETIKFKCEPVVRYQEFDPDRNVSGNISKWTSVGLNVYLKGHAVKAQADYTFKNEETNKVDNDVFQIQLQLDF